MNDTRPRLLVFPTANALEWPILPLLEEWADVAVVDGPWLHDGQAAVDAARELDARGWERAVVASDEWGVMKTIELAEMHPERIQALVLGHACLQLTTRGPRPTMSPEVVQGYLQLMRTDFKTWARALTQTTRGGFNDELVEQFMAASSHEDLLAMMERIQARDGHSWEHVLRALDVPMLLAWHKHCLLWTEEGFRDAAAALPDAQTVSIDEKCSTSPAFAEAMRKFCATAVA